METGVPGVKPPAGEAKWRHEEGGLLLVPPMPGWLQHHQQSWIEKGGYKSNGMKVLERKYQRKKKTRMLTETRDFFLNSIVQLGKSSLSYENKQDKVPYLKIRWSKLEMEQNIFARRRKKIGTIYDISVILPFITNCRQKIPVIDVGTAKFLYQIYYPKKNKIKS